MSVKKIKYKKVKSWRLKSKINCNYINIKQNGNYIKFDRDIIMVLLQKITKDYKLELSAGK